MDRPLKIAFVQDALPFQGGAEKVLEAALEVFPQAPVYTLVYRKQAFQGSPIQDRTVYTSFIDHLPAAQRRHRAYLPLMPLAIEQFDLSGYDVVVSFSYAVAHGILPRPDQLHISYVHTPLRYAWQMAHQYMQERSSWLPPLRWAIRLFLHSFRQWDAAAAARTDHFITVSEWMAECVLRAYGRRADVLYPPVDLEPYQPLFPRENYYLTVSRLVAHKKIDLIVAAFNQLGLPLVVVGEGPELGRLRRLAGPSVRLLGRQPQEQVAQLLGKARAFVHAGEEDFGIAMVEAQAAGCPAIALGRGAARETIRAGISGEFFADQTVESLAAAVRQFEMRAYAYDPLEIRRSAERFSRPRFLQEFAQWVQNDWLWFRSRAAHLDSFPIQHPAWNHTLPLDSHPERRK